MKQKTMVLIGAGNRGMYAYASYALRHPNELKFVAVAEPDTRRREEFCRLHGIAPQNAFSSWEELLAQPRLADAALIATQDQMHTGPALEALEKGYDVLLEKPMAVTPEECAAIQKKTEQTGRLLAVCHVLRYTRFFSQIRQLLQQGVIGRLVNIEHSENVAYWHFTHSYVRGPWRNSREASPVILAKCCHDMDILQWLADSRCKEVYSTGDLCHFSAQNATPDLPARCTDGCPDADSCPFNAARIYFEPHPDPALVPLIRMVSFDPSPEARMEALRTGPYGRCVYRCDNDAADCQLVNLTFENGVRASFTMSAFTNENVRRIRLMGTDGEIRGVMEENWVEYYQFSTGRTVRIELPQSDFGHSGGDDELMRGFVRLLNGEGENRTSARMSTESHLISFAAETSRMEKRAVDFEQYVRHVMEK